MLDGPIAIIVRDFFDKLVNGRLVGIVEVVQELNLTEEIYGFYGFDS